MDGLQLFIKHLKKQKELIEINQTVSPDLEITEITDRISKLPDGGKALLFSNTGTEFPLLINSLGSKERLSIAFHHRSPQELISLLMNLLEGFMNPSDKLGGKLALLPQLSKVSSWMPKKIKSKGACQEFVFEKPDLTRLPILKCWPFDGGRFITLPLVHTVDPVKGTRNVGMYRMQVYDSNKTGMHWQLHKTGARHFREYRRLKRKMPVAVALGGDPVYTYCATAPLPDGIDEYLLAGLIRQKAVNLVKCISQDLWVPEDADFIIEGYVDPDEPLKTEGPFGDHTGFYSLEDEYPIFHVTAITHRKDAVYPATIVGVPPMEDAWLAWMTEKLFLPAIKLTTIPEILDLHMPTAGVAHNLALIKIKTEYPGQARKTIHTVWGAGQMMFTKYTAVFDADTDLTDYMDLFRIISDRVNPSRHIERGFGPLDVLDHAAQEPFEGGKIGFDCTGPLLKESWRTKENPDPTLLATLRSSHPEITDMNLEYVSQGLSLGLISLRNCHRNRRMEMADEIVRTDALRKIRFWVLFNEEIDLKNPFLMTWIIGSHTDTSRDVWIVDTQDPDLPGLMFIDATSKSLNNDNFHRPWPNPVVMNDETIRKVDQLWSKLELGKHIESPSLKIKNLHTGSGAQV